MRPGTVYFATVLAQPLFTPALTKTLALLFSWIALTPVLAAETAAADSALYETAATVTADTPVDKLVLARLSAQGLKPARLCSDAVFVRRVYLDVIGTLPTMDEARGFLQDTNPKKRAQLIDQLLARDEFIDFWTLKWGDLLRVKAEYPINLWPEAAQAYHHWIRDAVARNETYDRFVRDLLTASGSNFRDPGVNFYRAVQGRDPEAIGHAVALTFMGVRSEKWERERREGLAAFFAKIGYKNTATWKEEIVFFDRFQITAAVSGRAALKPVFPDGTPAVFDEDRDPREVFADWLIRPENPWFTQNIANRVWSWLLGRGLINEPDDARPDNPPQNPELLAYLSQQLVAARYDLKALYRIILNSGTYQQSSIPAGKDIAVAEANFACYPVRRLDAEVLVDALCQISGTNEDYSSPIPEPFTFIPGEDRTIALPDGSITSSFLDLFGRPARDTGLEAERNNGFTASQALHLLNSSHVRRKIENGPKFWAMVKRSGAPANVLGNVYLTLLSRYPTAAEAQTVQAYFATGTAKGRDGVIDLAWALINSPEFIYRH